MKANEELQEVFPHLTGDWLKDKSKFIKEQQQLEEILDTETIIDDGESYE